MACGLAEPDLARQACIGAVEFDVIGDDAQLVALERALAEDVHDPEGDSTRSRYPTPLLPSVDHGAGSIGRSPAPRRRPGRGAPLAVAVAAFDPVRASPAPRAGAGPPYRMSATTFAASSPAALSVLGDGGTVAAAAAAALLLNARYAPSASRSRRTCRGPHGRGSCTPS